jgi:two-component sensor histidine kinase
MNRWLTLGVCLCLFPVAVLAQTRTIDSLRTVLGRPLPDTTRTNVCYDLAYAFRNKSQLDSARLYLSKIPALAQKTLFWPGLGNYYFLSGLLYRIEGNFEQALTYYQQALGYFEKGRRPSRVANVQNDMGYLYKLMGDSQHVETLTRQGIAYLNQAVAYNLASKRPSQLVGNYINLGICYEDLGDFAEAMRYFTLARQLAEPMKDGEMDLRIIYNNIGNLYTRQQQHEAAIPFLQKAVALNLKYSRKSSLVHNYRNLATAYHALNQLEQAQEFADKAYALLPESRDATLKSSVYKVLREIYAASGQHQLAYEFLLREKAAEDSLMTLEKTRTITNLQGKYEQQKAAELATIRAKLELEKTREIAGIEAITTREIATVEADKKRRIAQITAEAEVSKTRAVAEVQTRYETAKKTRQIADLSGENDLKARQMGYLGGSLGLVLLLLTISFIQYRAIRRANAQLSDQNRVIAENSQRLTEQSAQLRTLMRELHHRVKNNLAIVSSLLNLQTYRLTDTGAIEAVQESQRRVEAMSLIHQRLYRTDAVTTINMSEYITDLAESLMAAYGYGPDTFDLSVVVPEPELDVDVAIPMGLILNELLTNSFKYAYGINQHRIGRRKRPALTIALWQDTALTLEVQDNGPGLNLSQWQNPEAESDSFGRQLIWSLSEQTGGKLTVDNRDGAYFQLTIPQAA